MASVVSSTEINEWNRNNEQDDPIVALLRITSDELAEPLLISSDNTSYFRLNEETKEPEYGTVRSEEEYAYCPFKIVLPDQLSDGTIPSAQISIDNVDSIMYASLRELSIAPSLDIVIVNASDPDTNLMELPTLSATTITANVFSITATLSPDNFLSSACPAPKFYPSSNPTLV